LVQLAMVGALKAEHVAPVRHILEALFNGQQQHVVAALDGKPKPKMHALVDPEAPRRAEMERGVEARGPFSREERYELARQLAVRPSTLRAIEGELGRAAVERLARLADRKRDIVSPATEMMSEATRGRSIVEVIEACRS
jgi:hypothetical protein